MALAQKAAEAVKDAAKKGFKITEIFGWIGHAFSFLFGFGGLDKDGHNPIGWAEAAFSDKDQQEMLKRFFEEYSIKEIETLSGFFDYLFPDTDNTAINVLINNRQNSFRKFILNMDPVASKRLLQHLITIIESETNTVIGYEKAKDFLKTADVPIGNDIHKNFAKRMRASKQELEEKTVRNSGDWLSALLPFSAHARRTLKDK